MRSYLSILIVLMGFISCKKEFDEQAFLAEKVQLKIDQFLSEKNDECRKKAADEAVVSVDSIMVSIWSQINKFDSLEFPDRPVKPERPEEIIDLWEDPKGKTLDSIQ